MKKLIAFFTATIILVAFSMPVSAQNRGIYKHFDVSNTDCNKDTKLELNSINEGLRQAINDQCQNYQGCEVIFETNAHSDEYARFTANGFYTWLSDTVKSENGYFSFDFDKLNPNHNLWGCISQLEFECTDDVRIYDIYVYVPPQPIINDISAGASNYEVLRNLY